jgi:ubiquinone/menaquinone biosynthesis C-methylase UbiE
MEKRKIKNSYNNEYYSDLITQNIADLSNKYQKYISYISDTDFVNLNTVLDVGCGTGTLCGFLNMKLPRARIIGVDAFDIPLKKAKEKYKDIEFVKSDVEKAVLPFDNNMFDLVLAHELIEHLNNPSFFFKEVYRVLKANGVFLIKTPNRIDMKRLLAFLFGRIWYADLDKTHKKYYDVFSIKNELVNVGFSDVKAFSGTKDYYRRGLFRIPSMPILGHGLICLAKK